MVVLLWFFSFFFSFDGCLSSFIFTFSPELHPSGHPTDRCLFSPPRAAQIKVVNAFRSSLYEGLEKPESRSSIHNFMTHPEFILEEDEPRTPFLDGAEDDPEPDGLQKRGGGGLAGSTALNRNNNAVDSELSFPEPGSPFHSLETSV